ncbi:MAG: exodeoxyribonuclease III [Elusimicrobiaceae bacterium]|jgi:exodeoxyribonuclease-3
MKKLLSWNVNGIRAAEKKGFLNWLEAEQPYLLGVQETKAEPAQLSGNLLNPKGYLTFWSAAERKGYSGTAVFAREKPAGVSYGFGIPRFDSEGRTIVLEYPDFYFVNIYFPNGGASPERLQFKLDFYAAFLAFTRQLTAKGKAVIVCGDVNTAHKEIDLARPKENENNTGFLPEERAWLDRFFETFDDTFRLFHPEGGNYTWWDLKTRARERNVGWRLDYFLIDKQHSSLAADSYILPAAQGSDHCPIGFTLK